MGELLVNWVPMVTTNCDGALAVMVADPAEMQVAVPSLSMPASALLEDFHVSPSATVSCRLVWLLKFAVAVKVAFEFTIVAAVAGLTTMLVILG